MTDDQYLRAMCTPIMGLRAFFIAAWKASKQPKEEEEEEEEEEEVEWNTRHISTQTE